jgi:CRISPR-associated protein Csb2
MIAIKIIFPWGRYYAHPWGLNPVRLREAEWPPSPWRLLRALAQCWFQKNPGRLMSADAAALLEALGAELPEFGFRKVTFGHTVHYQPNYEGGEKQDARYKNVRHENHFVAVHGPVFFRWPGIDLSSSLETLLVGLLSELSYFGRSESVCHAETASSQSIDAESDIGWCYPTQGRRISSQCRDVFCPNNLDFRVADLWTRRADQGKANPLNAPEHLVDALLASDMRLEGARWISYIMPSDWTTNRVARVPRTTNQKPERRNDGPRIAKYMRFSLQCRVPLPPKFTVPLAEQFRRAASSHFSRVYEGQPSYALFGHPKDRPPDALGEHQHAFYLPMRNFPNEDICNQVGMIADLHVWCPYGLTAAETQVLLSIQRLTWRDGRYPVRPVLTAMNDRPPHDLPLATGDLKSRVWRSETPFVPPRHFFWGKRSNPKVREVESPELQLIDCLKKAGVTEPGEIRRLAISDVGRPPLNSLPPLPLWDIVRAPVEDEDSLAGAVVSPVHANGSDQTKSRHHQSVGFFMQIRFDKEVALPMPAFGKSNHFGLGIFMPDAD